MKYRALGRSGIKISEIGFGAWGIGGATPGATSYGRTDDRVSLSALHEALDRGITFFDTSSVYGYGHSEELLGQAFAGRRNSVVFATKAGLQRYGEPVDFSRAAISASVEESLTRLQTDYIDLLQLHSPAVDRLRESEDIAETAAELKWQGLIRSFGVSLRDPQDGFIALTQLQPDAIQVNFNLLDQRVIDCGLLAAAERARCAVVARTPLCFGFLSGQVSETTVFSPEDHRSRWPREQIAWWVKGGSAMRAHATSESDQTLSQFALRFGISFPAVGAVIPGMLTPAEVIENAKASTLGPLPDSVLAAVRTSYGRLDQPPKKPADPGRVDGTHASHSA